MLSSSSLACSIHSCRLCHGSFQQLVMMFPKSPFVPAGALEPARQTLVCSAIKKLPPFVVVTYKVGDFNVTKDA